MPHRYAELTATEAVRAAQERYGTREHNARREARSGPNAALGPRETAFIAERDSFYMATVSETGWPYVQHRGGPAGFLEVIGPTTLAFADFRGNLQYVSVGNLAHDTRVSLILVDYANRRRLKILGHARVVDVGTAPPELMAQVQVADYGTQVERLMLIEVEAFDWNCSQHITPRFTEREVQAALQPLKERIAGLEARLDSMHHAKKGE
jgi:hypothetical protein